MCQRVPALTGAIGQGELLAQGADQQVAVADIGLEGRDVDTPRPGGAPHRRVRREPEGALARFRHGRLSRTRHRQSVEKAEVARKGTPREGSVALVGGCRPTLTGAQCQLEHHAADGVLHLLDTLADTQLVQQRTPAHGVIDQQ